MRLMRAVGGLFDATDRKVLAGLIVIVAGAGGLLLAVVAVLGLAWRVFERTAGI